MNIGEMCRHEVFTMSSAEELVAAARLMRDKHIGYVIVVEPRVVSQTMAPIGVLTDRDIVIAVVARDVDIRSLRVEDVMTREPLLLSESESLEAALREMRLRGVRRAPVVADSGQLVGVVSLDDLLSVLAGELQDVSWSIERGRRVEQALRP